MMKCPNCGNSLSDSAKFCPKCGTKLGAAGSPASGNIPAQGRGQRPAPSGARPGQPPRGAQPPRTPQTPRAAAPNPSVQPPQYPQHAGKKSRAPLIIAIIAAVVVISGAAVGATLFFVNRSREKAEITSNVWGGAEDGEKKEKQTETVAAGTSQSVREPVTEAVTTSQPVTTAPAETVGSETPAGVEGYILPDSSVRYLTDQDLAGLSSDQLRLARNEIYARHGRKFKDEALQAYFNSQPWYTGTVEPDRFNDDALLNDVERKNLDLIKAREAVLN